MAESQKVKVKKASYQNYLFDPENPTTYWKPALVTPVVVGQKKFAENVAEETGQDPYMLGGILGRIFRTAGDYMTLGNAVQLHEDFGTLKPFIRVKSVKDKDKCNRSCIVGIGIKFIPTGKMKTMLENVQFVFMGDSDGTDVEDSELVDTPDQNQGGGQQQEPSGSNASTGGGTGGSATQVTVQWKRGAETVKTMQVAPGGTIQQSDIPANIGSNTWDKNLTQINSLLASATAGSTITVTESGDSF